MHDVAIKTLTPPRLANIMWQPTGCTWQGNKQHSARARSVCQSSDLFSEDELTPEDPDGQLGANGATSAEKVHRVMEEFKCTKMSVTVVLWLMQLPHIDYRLLAWAFVCSISMFLAFLPQFPALTRRLSFDLELYCSSQIQDLKMRNS